MNEQSNMGPIVIGIVLVIIVIGAYFLFFAGNGTATPSTTTGTIDNTIPAGTGGTPNPYQ